MIKEVRVLKHLRGTGGVEWEKGLILKHPIPHDILLEIKWNTGLVEVLSEGSEMISTVPPPPEVPTTTSNVKTDNNLKPDEPMVTQTEPETEPPESTKGKPSAKGKAKTKPSRRMRR